MRLLCEITWCLLLHSVYQEKVAISNLIALDFGALFVCSQIFTKNRLHRPRMIFFSLDVLLYKSNMTA